MSRRCAFARRYSFCGSKRLNDAVIQSAIQYGFDMATVNPQKRREGRVLKDLGLLYSEPKTALQYDNPVQLLVAVILSAQCTDARVNLVTPKLFARFPDTKALASADREELEALIKSTGFFRNKAK